MKNLKRVLALVLVVATLCGFATVASAASFPDDETITNVEAAKMLTDLGVIGGYPDGTFRGGNTVTRAEMAKMIYVITTGDADASGFEGAATTLTDIKGHWAEGYIKYCYSLNIISGYTDGTFQPDRKINVAEAAKMLLVAIGYDADQYTGATWSANVMRDAKSSDITDDVKATAVLAATRDIAAQMIFNTLFAENVTAQYQYDMGVKYVTGHYGNGDFLSEIFDLAKDEGIVSAVAEKTVTVGGTVYDLPGSYDMIGKTGIVYYKTTAAGTFKELYSTEVIINEDTVLLTTTDGTSMYNSAVNTDKKKVTLNTTTGAGNDITIYVNGTGTAYEVTSIAAGTPNTGVTNGKGTVVEYIDADADKDVDVIKVTNIGVYEITAYNTLTKKLTLAAKGNNTTVTTLNPEFKNVPGYENFAKGDYVLAMESCGKVFLTATTTVSGKISSYDASASAIVIDGTSYKVAADYDAVTTCKTLDATAIGTEGKFVLDTNGYVVFYKANGSTVNADNLAFVLAVKGWDSFTSTQQVKLGFADGTTAVVTVEKCDSKVSGTTATIAADNVVAQNKVVTFTVADNGNYTVKNQTITDAGATTIVKGKPMSIDSKLVTSATLFVDLKNGKTYTGYENMPSQTTTDAYVYGASTKAEVVFITGTSMTNDSDSTKFYIYKGAAYVAAQNADKEAYMTYTAIVDGEIKTIDIKGSTPLATGLYTAATLDKNGMVATYSPTQAQTAITADVTATDNASVMTLDGKNWVLNADTKYFMIDKSDSTATEVNADYVNLATTTGVYVQAAGSDGAKAYTAAIVYMVQD